MTSSEPPPLPPPPPVVHLTPLDPRYPSRLRGSPHAPASLSTQGGSLEAERVVAIVGSRKSDEEARAYARELARDLAAAGAVVASGGAVGIDAAAHRGALQAGGRTWVVAATGHERCFPDDHQELYAEVARGPGAMIWPFAPGRPALLASFHSRNKVLVALADAFVVIQAGADSGALSAARHARSEGRPLWVAPMPPWLKEDATGSWELLDGGARPLRSTPAFLAALGSGPLAPPPPHVANRALSESEDAVLRVTSTAPLHLDQIAHRSGRPVEVVSAALLTLALEHVLVEGPPGFYRRRDV